RILVENRNVEFIGPFLQADPTQWDLPAMNHLGAVEVERFLKDLSFDDNANHPIIGRFGEGGRQVKLPSIVDRQVEREYSPLARTGPEELPAVCPMRAPIGHVHLR